MEQSANQSKQRDESTIPLTDWKNPPSLEDLKGDMREALPEHDKQIGRISTWLDNLNVTGGAQPKMVKGRSSVQPRVIRKQAEWRYASLSEPFLNTPDMFAVAPVTWEDKNAAEQNALVLNNQFNTQVNKVTLIDEYVRTAVDEGTVILRVGWENEEESYIESQPVYEFVPAPDSLPMFMQLQKMKEDNPTGYKWDVPEPLQKAHDYFTQTGVPVHPNQVGTQRVPAVRTLKNRPTIEVCDYRNIIVDPTCKGNLSKAQFIIYRFPSSLSDLEKDGRYSNLDRINVSTNSPLGSPDYETEDESNFTFSDEPRKQIIVHEYWGYRDIDGSGVTKPFVAAWVGDTLIRMEENPFPDKEHPFVGSHYLPVRRKTHGEPDGHLLEDNQKIIGAVTRGMIDLMGRSANAQTAFRKNTLDTVNRRKFERGDDYEINGQVSPDQAIYTHRYPEIPASAQFMLQLQNFDAESMSGVKAFSGEGISGAGLGASATAARGALDAASEREMGILRRLSQGLIDAGRKIIAMNAEFLDEEEVVRITNDEFVNVRRDDLAGKFDLRLDISTAEDDNAKAGELSFMLQTLGPNEDPELRKMILTDIAKLRRMPGLAKRLEDYQPQPDPMQQQLQEMQLLKLQAEIQVLYGKAGESEASAILDRAKSITEQAKAVNISSDTDIKTLDFVEQESGVTQERLLEQQGEQARGNIELEREKQRISIDERGREQLSNYLKQKT